MRAHSMNDRSRRSTRFSRRRRVGTTFDLLTSTLTGIVPMARHRLRFVFAFAFLWLAPMQASAQANTQLTPIQRIRGNPRQYVNEQVTVVGKVVRYVDAKGSNAFYFEDEYGTQIRILSTASLPAIDSRWSIDGVVAIETSGDPYLVESKRTSTDAPPPAPLATTPSDADLDGVPDAADRCPNSAPGKVVDATGCEANDRSLLYYGLGGVALLIMGGGLYMSQQSRQRQREEEERRVRDEADRRRREEEERLRREREEKEKSLNLGGGGGNSSGVADADVFAGKTIRFARPNSMDGTLKLVPGRLEVVSGPDKGNEIRFVHVGTPVPEVTFGRSDGPKYTHVTLTSPTVSRRHAMMRYEAGAWSIANFSDTNAVMVNGTALVSIGTPVTLKEGDLIEFGEVSVKFHSR